jgi:tRNA-specific 2-thiouridylase
VADRPILAVGLFSGGLDSLLAVKLLQRMGVEVLALTFESPFFGSGKAVNAAGRIGVRIEVRDVTRLILPIVEDPPHGHGKNLNPCIDCHAMMFHEAGKRMDEIGASFLFSGEVLGQRPFSQNYASLRVVAEESGYAEWIVRPLSARLLPVTRPEAEGWVDRRRLLDIQGRCRARQIALAAEWGITDYASPAGGCSLTDPGFAHRLRDLLQHEGRLVPRSVDLLRVGRHFRLGERTKAVVGRKHSENEALRRLAVPEDAVLEVRSHPGPVVLVVGPHGAEDLETAARLAVRYSDAPREEPAAVDVENAGGTSETTARAAEDDLLDRLRI